MAKREKTVIEETAIEFAKDLFKSAVCMAMLAGIPEQDIMTILRGEIEDLKEEDE